LFCGVTHCIDVGNGTDGLPNLNAYRYLNHAEGDYPEITKTSSEIVSLPMYPELREEEIWRIAETIRSFRP